ncbi:NAD-binding protein [archaeon]|nr:NAD-binding protein [archaeon]
MISARGLALEQKILIVVSAFLVTLVGGTLAFSLLEGMTLRDSFSLTFGSALGHGIQERFHTATIALSVFIAIMLWACAWMAFEGIVEYISEKKAREVVEGKRVAKMASKLRNHFIVVGAGRVGMTICKVLKEQGKRVIIVEKQSEVAQEMIKQGFAVIQGDVTDERVMELAGVRHASTVITAMGSDSENVFVTLSAKELNPHVKVVARAEKSNAIHKLRQAGADEVISPALLGAQKMAEAALHFYTKK